MKILLISTWAPRKGGIVSHIENILRHSKNEFKVLTYNSSHEEGNVIRARFINIPILRAITFVISGFLKGLKVECDIIHAHYAVPQGFLGVLLKKWKKRPLVLTVHGSDVTVLGGNPFSRPVVKYVLNNADEIIAVSRFLQGEVLKLGIEKEKVRVIYNGVSVKGCRARKFEAKGMVILFIGSLVYQKGVDVLLRAFRKVKDSYSNAELVIAGDGKERRRLEALAKKLALKDCRFLGYVDSTGDILKKSHALVLPSREEGWGLVLLEAMSCNIPVVATKVGGIEEIVKDGYNGILVKSGDSDALAKGILRVLEDDELKKLIVKNGRSFAAGFDWEKMASEVDTLYESLSLTA